MELNTVVVMVGLAVNTIVLLTFAWKTSRFMARMELKVDMMWTQFTRQMRRTDFEAIEESEKEN